MTKEISIKIVNFIFKTLGAGVLVIGHAMVNRHYFLKKTSLLLGVVQTN